MRTSSDKAGLELLLRDMYEALSELSLVLEQEYEALDKTDIDNLQVAAKNKERLSAKIEVLEKSRITRLRKAGFSEPDKASMSRFILQAVGEDGADTVTGIWEMVEELARKCDNQNKVNGIVIDNTKRQTQEALSILKGHLATENNLYDADGTSVSQSSQTTLARA